MPQPFPVFLVQVRLARRQVDFPAQHKGSECAGADVERIAVGHDERRILADVERVCDAVAILERGQVVASAGVADLTARAAVNRLVVEVEDDRSLASLRSELSGRTWVASLEVDARSLRVTVTELAAAQREIPAAIAAAGVALRRFEIEEASLEDVFVQLVGGQRQ